MKKISILMMTVFVAFSLFGCSQKLTREEAETKLEKCGLMSFETCGLIHEDFVDGVDIEHTGKILDKLAQAGFIKITPMRQWKYRDATIVARLDTKTNTWTIEPGPHSDEWTVGRYADSSLAAHGWYEDRAEAKDSFEILRLINRYDVVINYPDSRNLLVKDGKLRIVLLRDANFKVTGILQVSPTLDMVQYTAEETATYEGAAIIGTKSSTIEGTMKFMRYDDGWRPVL
jgi:hypothetical protein